MTGGYLLALDEGSTSARSVVVDASGAILGEARTAVNWHRPRPGWVELDPVALWQGQLATATRVLRDTGIAASELSAVAVTSHRETVMIWDRRTGAPVHDALVWISKQTDPIVDRWRRAGLDEEFRRRTGLRNDSFFSAAKVAWLLENVADVRRRAEAGELACGTVDTWLVWNLTGGRTHQTDHSCASRTALFDLSARRWDAELCDWLHIPVSLFPDATASDAEFGCTDPDGRVGTDPRGHGRPAGRHVRAGLLRRRRGEEHLRHGRRADGQLRPDSPVGRRSDLERGLDRAGPHRL
jgi:glycerol kinase